MKQNNKIKTIALKCAYGALFVAIWPTLLLVWSLRLDSLGTLAWPIPLPSWLAICILIIGVVLMGFGMHALWAFGSGLPMNAFPPKRFVERSVFNLVSHPIYVGFSLFVFSAAALLKSPFGFWIAAPIALCASAALVFGYEGPELRRRFGPPSSQPLLSLPRPSDTKLPLSKRLALIVVAWGPWAITYALLSQMPPPAGAHELRFSFEFAWQHSQFWMWIYSSAYLFVGLAPLAFRSGQEARNYITGIWTASFIGLAAFLLFPGKAEFLQLSGSAGSWLMDLNRSLDAEWLACPSFHTAWAIVAAGIYARADRKLSIPVFLYAALVAYSCIGSGSHALIDIVGGTFLAVIALGFSTAACAGMRLAEQIANSWTAWQIGRFRIISHIVWTALSAFVGTLLALWLAGPERAWPFVGIMIAGVLGALAFGRLVEGRHLSRPFGYFGFLFGSLTALVILFAVAPDLAANLAAAIAVAAPAAQAIGRGRCLVQGCCHGRPGHGSWTIKVHNPMSRIVCVAAFDGKPVYATQVLSALLNTGIAIILWLAWKTGAQATLICGLYLILTALSRFAEEGWRGEPQTPNSFGLSIYQWMCIGLMVAGIFVTMVPSPSVAAVTSFGAINIVCALIVSAIMSLMMSIDWPDSGLPLSRLAPQSIRKSED